MKQGKKLLSLFLAAAVAVSGINFAGAIQAEAAVVRTEATPGDGTQTSPGDGTQTSPGDGTQTSPGDGTQTSPGDGTQTSPGDGTAKVTEVKVTPKTASVEKGKKQTFTAEVKGTNLDELAEDKKGVTWSVNSTTSTISATGELSVAADETAATLIVTATAKADSEKTDTATVTVTSEEPVDPEVKITGVEVTPKTASVEKGKKQTFTAEVKGTNLDKLTDAQKGVTWSVNSTTSTISATGELSVAADETAATLTVTATAKADSTKTDTATVTVTSSGTEGPKDEAKVTSVTVAPKTANVTQGKTQTFTATVNGTNLTPADKAVTWTVTGAKSTGTKMNGATLTVAANETAATLTVKATSQKDKAVSGTATVSVKKAVVKVSSVKITNGNLKIAAGKKVKLAVKVLPSNASNKAVTWSIAKKDQKYAKVNAKGQVTTTKNGAGKKVKVTATAKDGSKKKSTITITIMKNSVTKVSLKAKKTVKAGKKITVKATVKTNGKKANKTLTWSLDKNSAKYASVNKKGVVTTKKTGKGKTIKVTATATDGSNKKATIKIKIVK